MAVNGRLGPAQDGAAPMAGFARPGASAMVAAPMTAADPPVPDAIPTPFVAEGMRVLPAWLDANGHMNVAWYVHVFDEALSGAFAGLGMDLQAMIAAGRSAFTVEMHVTYQHELLRGEPLRATTQLIGADAKRLHFFQRLYQAEAGFLAATCEWLLLYIDMEARRAVEMSPALQALMARVRDAHGRLPTAPELGRAVSLTGRKAGAVGHPSTGSG
jgi:acyl-CoA thioester hydrolase